jgi:E3 ubiquitin-protein ligase synoviolin
MILTNLLFVIACSFLLGLQKLLYGNLRPIEVEQLYEKAWFAVTETCLAMTVFRGEIGLTFLAMFFSLLTGKVWGWIGEGRVEVLEQQPPQNPRLFHTRLALSLGLSVAFDLTMLEYVVKQVLRMARPDMMVMFGFEFAVLSIMSISTAMRYAINLVEIGIVREQKRQRIEEIKKERMQTAVTQYQEALARETDNADPSATPDDSATPAPAPASTPTPTQRTLEQTIQDALNETVDENEVEVEGWEDKGRYIFYLDLATDFFKLVIYLAFFFILLIFYGLPIHILRDVFLTMRSFLKRISDFMKYRTATRDMNERYPDATAEDIGREDVCIICREEMRPYQAPVVEEGQQQPRPNPMAERMRPKKLPCGHVLHFSCLRSWLERQQICPTCRANVVQTGRTPNTNTGTDAAGGQAGGRQAEAGQHQHGARQGPRVYQFGPLRIGVGAVRGGNMFEELQQQLAADGRPGDPPQANGDANGPRQFGMGVRWAGLRGRGARLRTLSTREGLDYVEAQIRREIEELSRETNELGVLRSMQAELQRLRALRSGTTQEQATTTGAAQASLQSGVSPSAQGTSTTALASDGQQNVVEAGSDRLPAGLTLPEGWTMMPLHAVPQNQPVQAPVFNGQPLPSQYIATGQAFGYLPFNFTQPAVNNLMQMPNNRPGTNTSASEPTATGQTNGTAEAAATTAQSQPNRSNVDPLDPLSRLANASLQQEQHEQWLASLRNGSDRNGVSAPPTTGTTNHAPGIPRNGNTAENEQRDQSSSHDHSESSSSRLPLPTWGTSAPDNATERNISSTTSLTNGNHELEDGDETSSNLKNRHATVEDLVEDPD